MTILDPVLQALVAAHRAGFVHRDVKPENVLLGDDGSVKVADFGLARAISASNSTATQGVIIGTVAYLSPEQVERGVADARSDVYGCGILLYEMLTGAVPYAGETPLAVAYQHVNAAVPMPSSVDPGIPPAVDLLVARATRRDPDDRWPDAAEFLDAVREARRHLPTPRPMSVDLSDGSSTLIVPLPTDAHAATGPIGTPPGTRPVKRRRSRGGPLVLLAILLIAGLVGAAGWWYGSARTVPVPAVLDRTMAQAQQAFADSELTLEAGEKAFSETVAAGKIISTDPAAGTEATVGDTVVATVSRGPERFTVPEVAEDTIKDATTKITDANLTVADTTIAVYDEKITKGLVVSSKPKVGSKQRADTTITLRVSKGPKPVPVPTGLTGKKQANAEKALDKVGLRGNPTDGYSTTVKPGRVISTDPPAGTPVARDGSVTLVVSQGPPPVTCPAFSVRARVPRSRRWRTSV